jgi:hypothetical protein
MTQNNTSGSVLAITNIWTNQRLFPIPSPAPLSAPTRQSLRHQTPVTPINIPRVRFENIPGGIRHAPMISQEAINFLTKCVWSKSPDIFKPSKQQSKSTASRLDFEQVAMPMVHPTTGETISSYKWPMNNPATAKMWLTAFGKDFGGMVQGDNKTGQKGTNSIFVMTHDDIAQIPKNQTLIYARVVVDFCPQKSDPHHICITPGGNLINYLGELSTRTADLTTSKLMWNSVLSTEGAKYMCLNIKNFYLTAPLDRFECMKMPLVLFPEWIKKNIDLDKYTLNRFVYLEMQQAVLGLPQAGILANKLLRHPLLPHGYYECNNTPGLWKHQTCPIALTLVVDNFRVKYVGKEHTDHLIQCI